MRRPLRCRCGRRRGDTRPLCDVCLAQLPGNLRATLVIAWDDARRSLDRPIPAAPPAGQPRLLAPA